ncbi:MAG: glycosyltransferase family 4 protein [Solirubrobacteraceae bacterium]
MTVRVAFDARDAVAERRRGWGRYAAELLAALRRRDDVAVGAYVGGGRLPEIAWEQVGWPARLRTDAPDVLHAPNCFLPLWRPCPGVVTIHDLAFEAHPEDFAPRTGWKYRTFTRRAALSAEAVVVDTRATADDLCERYGADPDRIHVVPLAPSLAVGDAIGAPGVARPRTGDTVGGRGPGEGRPTGAPSIGSGRPRGGDGADDRPYLLAIGDLRGKKNLELLTDAWRMSGLPHRLVLAGTGPDTRDPEGAALVARLRAAGAELPGWMAEEDLDRLLRGADLLVHPSRFEGFGLVLLEAMVRGVPVACSDIPSLRETAGGAAELFDPRDADDIARALHDALGRRAALAAAGRAHAARFDWDQTAARTADVYRLVRL